MDLPKPPDEPELKNIIDKLANFVARNGPEFEQMTKEKQKDNKKFSFLFGGEHFNYYQFKVVTEQAVMNQQTQKSAVQVGMIPEQSQCAIMPIPGMSSLSMQSGPPPMPPSNSSWQPNPQQLQQIQQVQEQLDQMRKNNVEQVKQSDSNLAAQYQSLMQQRQLQIEEAIALAQEEEIVNLSTECNISLEEFEKVLKPITESCTKDAISNGKNWIFSHNISENHGRLIALYMKKKIIANEATFEQRLFLIYLINDVLHHCMRKNAAELRKSFESVVTHIFCMAHLGAREENQQKLSKLLNLWDQNKYFDAAIIHELREPGAQTMVNYQNRLSEQYPDVSGKISQAANVRYTSLQQQHQEFVNHLDSQVKQLEQQIQQLRQPPGDSMGLGGHPQVPPPAPGMGGSTIPIPGFPPPNFNQPPPNFSQPPPGFPPPATTQFEYSHGQRPPVIQEYNHGQTISTPPPSSVSTTSMTAGGTSTSTAGPPIPLPDLSKPPPGFPPLSGGPPVGPPAMPPVPPMSLPPPQPVSDADLMPSVPYFELPAGLMAPLVKLEDSAYRSLDPKDIRLPPPMPPSERLLAAVEAFYSAPSHDRPRDGEGWEKLGLFEFFKAKEKAKKLKEQERRDRRSNSTSSSSSSSSSSRSSSRSRSDSRSRSVSPRRRRSRSRSYSRSPVSRSRRSHTKSRSRSPSPGRKSTERSPSPPMFSAPFYATNTNTSLGDENKGRMLLKKMGWGGGGLGSSEQGIVNPVEHAEVREKVDMFKGFGMSNNDPFEQFRKNKSQGFIQRMKERDPAAP